MKKVISNQELQQAMREAVNLLCNTVGSTLGPSGNNVILNTDDTNPYITNDGVTIARAIESEDKIINTVLEITKEASLKTNELVGDGTTTTLVILQNIFNEGLKEIKVGKDPIILKQELNQAVLNVIMELDKIKKKPSKNNFIAIASTSVNDEQLGSFLAQIFFKMKSKYAIRIEESPNEKTYFEVKKGYSIDCDNISNMYFQKQDEIVLKNAYTLILNGYLENLEQISDIINEGILNNKKIVILAEDFNDSLNQEILLYYLQHNKSIFLFKLPEYGIRKEAISQDISLLTSSIIKEINYETVRWKDLGLASNVIIKRNEVLIINDCKDDIKLDKLKEDMNSTLSDYDKDFLAERIAKLENGIATIYVGATTKTEKKEKMMRIEDALFSLEISKKGVVAGEGVTLLEISDKMKEVTNGDKIIKNSLLIPFKRIMQNSAVDYQKIKQQISVNKYKQIYNLQTHKLENINDSMVLDSVEVLKIALKNAVSIAGILLTTNHLVINEKNEKDNIVI